VISRSTCQTPRFSHNTGAIRNRERVAEHFLKQFRFWVYLARVRHHWVRYHRSIEVRISLATASPGSSSNGTACANDRA
jgi:hypothetical protein